MQVSKHTNNNANITSNQGTKSLLAYTKDRSFSFSIFLTFSTQIILILIYCALLSSCVKAKIKNLDHTCIKYRLKDYSVLGVRFARNNNKMLLIRNASACQSQKSFNNFSGVFEVNVPNKEVKSYGESAFLQMTIFQDEKEFLQLPQKASLDFINFTMNRRIKEMEYAILDAKSRFTDIKYNESKIINNGAAICRTLYTSTNDIKANNIPQGESYLIMHNIYRTCYIVNESMFIDLALSVRVPKQIKINEQIMQSELNKLEKNLLFEKSKSIFRDIINYEKNKK